MIRKWLIGSVVAACALLLTVTLVAQPSPNRPGAARTEEPLAAPVSVVRVAPADFTEKIQDTNTDFWRRKARLPEEWLPIPSGTEHVLTAEQALEYGIVDEVIDR